MSISDDESTPSSPPAALADPHGHAALVLVESLIHGLCEAAALSPEQAVAIAERAIDVQVDIASASDDEASPMWRSYTLLKTIVASLRLDADIRSPRARP